MAAAQTTSPEANDVPMNVYNGTNFNTRYIDTDKTGRLQFIMYGQDPTVSFYQLRPQRRVFGPSIVCGTTFDSTCDVVASEVSIYAAQISDATAMGRSMLTSSDATAARLAMGAGTSNFDGAYTSLTSVPSSFTPAAHTQASTTISDSTATGRAILTASTVASARSTLGVQSTSEAAAAYYPASGNPSAFLTSVSSAQVTSALGFTPYNSSNPSAYITAAALSPYLTSATAASTYATSSALTSGLAGKFAAPTGTTAQYLRGDGSNATFPTIPPAISLTTTGSGAATLNAGTGALNIPTPPAASPFNYGVPTAKTVAISTAYQAADPSKAAVVTITPACTNTTTVLAASACTMQVRQSSAAGLTCSTGTVVSTWSSTIALGLVITQGNSFPVDVKLPAGGYFVVCPSAGTFTLSAVEQSAG